VTDVEYWDKIARDGTTLKDTSAVYSDNHFKRRKLVHFLLQYEWAIGERILEVGCGVGLTAGVMKLLCGTRWKHTARELSPH